MSEATRGAWGVVPPREALSEEVPGALPLAGMRVVELSSFVAVPLGGMTLAQLGADVIRVDQIGGGPDIDRRPLAPSGRSLYWAGLNKGKRSVTVDLRSPEGRDLVADLVTGSGVVITNAPPREGLTHEALRERRPDLIHVQLQGRRDGGNAVDYTVNAALGFPFITGPSDQAAPVNHALPAWDVACGLYLAVGLLAAERHRLRTGEGRRIRVALQDVALATAGNLGYLAEAQLGGVRPRLGNSLYGDFGRDFATADGRVMVVALTARHWRDLVDATGFGEVTAALERALGADFRGAGDRYAYRETLAGVLAPWFASRTCAEVEDALKGTSVLWSRYRDFTEVAAGLDAEPLMAELEQPGIGAHLAPGSPLRIGEASVPPAPAPDLGQHTGEVLRDVLSLSPEEADALRARRIAGEA
ncbi:CoA transferase [Actinomadura livida]|uniref:2-methylfumaryl-CoA isomerase n=1 Tax=Actinomadura livida TaxID=79909 RepID=A0A7W7MZV0_9ACTN|nr:MULTISPECIES: CoA transferase [Actinomadura]MBB4776449.1 2-methylfumaryl-CoA isomerase [Actinomadura catellatispora]GGT92394.1 dehydratase [Actinomadura livida]